MLNLSSNLIASASSLVIGRGGHVFMIDDSNVNVLDCNLSLETSIPFSSAFPFHREKLQAVACDLTSNKIAAISNGRVGIWETTVKGWRVHSSFVISHKATVIDFSHGKIAVGGDEVSIWSLDEISALPTWQKVSKLVPRSPILSVRLSPSADLVAVVTLASNTVKIYQIESGSTGMRYLSHVIHSTRVRSISWRPDETSTDSGPVLYTTTIDGHFRIWGCMIDEPLIFSLWATIDAQSTFPKHIPISTNFLRTRAMNLENTAGTMDDFLVVFSDGSAKVTTVTNFDSRPPTFLSQSSRQLHPKLVPDDQLINLRFTSILASTDPSAFNLIGRCSKGTIVSVNLPNLDQDSKLSAQSKSIPLNRTGKIQRIVPAAGGDVVILIGNEGRLQWLQCLEEGGVEDLNFVQSVFEPNSLLASWNQGQTIAIFSSTTIQIFTFDEERLVLASTYTHMTPLFLLVFQFSTSDSEGTTLVGTTHDHQMLFWTVDRFNQVEAVSMKQDELDRSLITLSTIIPSSNPSESICSTISSDGVLRFWSLILPVKSDSKWKPRSFVRTGLKGAVLMRCNQYFITALVTLDDGTEELSIWDSKESEFASGLQFSQINSLSINSLEWSNDGATLALASCSSKVTLMCSQRLDNLSDKAGWLAYSTIDIDHLSLSPITSISWLPNQELAISFDQTLLIYSSEMLDGQNSHQVAAAYASPLPYHHPQLLFQALLHGKTEVVIKILVGLARQLTDKGDLTPIDFESSAPRRITIDDFLSSSQTILSAPSDEVFSALANATARSKTETKVILTEHDTVRLLATLSKNSLRGFSKLEHAHLTLLVQTIYETQTQQNGLDPNGLRYLISMRSFFMYESIILPPSSNISSKSTSVSRLKYRDIVWAHHSDNQDALLEASIKACPGKLTWENAKALGIFMWLSSPEVLARQMEAVGRNEYTKSPDNEKDPISASLFYLALKKKHMVATLWKQAGGHTDQRSMSNLLMNDFEEPRWKSAALKNAYALLSKRRFHFAASFFLLGGNLKDAVNVCLRQLDDFQLAIAITRAYEGDNGPVLRSILEEHVLPFAFKVGFRWLASWSFWMLNRRDLAVQVIITPLRDLAKKLPYKLTSIGSPMHEDPALVFLYSYLRSYSLQTVKGAIAVRGQTEFNFILHIARVLCRMGCHVLAVELVREWKFLAPSAEVSRPLYALRKNSTKFDVVIPSTLPSRASTPTAQFQEVVKKVATAAPPEFNMDSFAF